MASPVDRLTLDFLEWIALEPRTYAAAMDAWRTSCPRLTVWEDALQAGLIQVTGNGSRRHSIVSITPHGLAVLHQEER